MWVGLTAGIGVMITARPLYTVVVLFWIDRSVSLVRRFGLLLFASPRPSVTPTGKSRAPKSGHSTFSPYEMGLFRFFTPKVGSITLSERIPPIAVHNLRPFVNTLLLGLVFVPLPVLAITWAEPTSSVMAAFWTPTTQLVGAGGVLAACMKHVHLARLQRTPTYPTGDSVFPGWRLGLWAVYWVPLWGLAVIYTAGPSVDSLTTVVAVGLVVVHTIRDTRQFDAAEQTGTQAVQTPEQQDQRHANSLPSVPPETVVRPTRRAVHIGGAIDSLVPIGHAAGSIRRITGQSAILVVLVVGVPVLSHELLSSASPWVFLGLTSCSVAIYLGGIALVGALHYDITFGTTEYRLYEDTLVAYDRRLDAVQWSVPYASIATVSVRDGWFDSPSRTDVGTVTITRTHSSDQQEPYQFYWESIVFVDDPNRIANLVTAARDGTRQRD